MVWFVKDVQKREFAADGTFSEVVFSNATIASAGSTVLVPAQVGAKVTVMSICVISATPNNVTFQSNATTNISASFPYSTNGGMVLPYSRHGWFETNVGEALTVTTSSAGPTAIQIVWCPTA